MSMLHLVYNMQVIKHLAPNSETYTIAIWDADNSVMGYEFKYEHREAR